MYLNENLKSLDSGFGDGPPISIHKCDRKWTLGPRAFNTSQEHQHRKKISFVAIDTLLGSVLQVMSP